MGEKTAAPDEAVGLVAARQHGVLSAAQLHDAGVTKDAIRRRVQSGRLYRIYQGVYAVGHRGLSQESQWMAAVLACCGHGGIAAQDAFLSHRSAAALWRLLAPRGGSVDVAIIGESGREKRAGVRIHRPRTLEAGMTTRRHGIPVTNPRRTVSDLRQAGPSRGGANSAEIRRAMRQAAILGLPLGPGTRRERTRSDLERLFLDICRRGGIPAPQVNTKVRGIEVDFLWRERGVIVETDGYRYHRGRIAFEDDRSRDLKLRALGFEVIRLSEAQLENESNEVAAVVRHLLAAA